MPKTIFARKPINLAQVKSDTTEEMKRLFNSQGDDYYVAEELKLSNREWESLTDSLLEDRFCFHRFSERHLPTTEEGVPCVRVTTPGSQIALIVDTQGYDYARYVGIEENSSQIEDEDEYDAEDEDEWEEDDDEPAEGLTEEAVEQALWGMLIGEWDVDNSLLMGCSARTYSDAGVLTYNKGLVITMPDGSEFQLTIVQSR